MDTVFRLLASAASFYSILIFIRIILTWFSMGVPSKPVEILSRITDPYLNWWRRRLNLRLGILDLSPIVGITALFIIQRIFSLISVSGRISIGVILSIVLGSIWSIAAFILGFCFILFLFRLIAFITRRDVYRSFFWRTIDTITQPVLYKLNRIIFGNRIPGYLQGILFPMLLLGAAWIGGGFLIPRLAQLLTRLPF